MGLDMYFKEQVYFSVYEDNEVSQAVMKAIGREKTPFCALNGVDLRVGYWRKANQIHGWFVDNCAGGEDDCKPMLVPQTKIQKLHDLCVEALEKRTDMLLPSREGFFFGPSSADDPEYYYEMLEYTRDVMAHALANPKNDYYYEASW
jgi:hypothetical protein